MRFLERIYLWEILKGLALTARHFWRNILAHALHGLRLRRAPGGVTVQYPEVRRPVAGRARHLHRLMKRPDGTPRCVACMLCPSACPAKCINVVAEEVADPLVEKAPARFEIDISRCVFCGMCVEACPVDAIRMDTAVIPPASYDRYRMVLRKEQLLEMEPSGGTLRSFSGRLNVG